MHPNSRSSILKGVWNSDDKMWNTSPLPQIDFGEEMSLQRKAFQFIQIIVSFPKYGA